jgi:tetratricopeptide (TPR) repeat protein
LRHFHRHRAGRGVACRVVIPYKSAKAPTRAADASAREHLKKAITQYEAALALDPRNLLARLGYAWMLDQAGEKARAIAEYRQVINNAWIVEEGAARRFREDRFFTHEAAGYLIPLLDSEKDAREVADLLAKRTLVESKPPRMITPLAIPLADDVAPDKIAAPRARVAFDADGSGRRRHWTWISSDVGWLVHDPEGRGEITSALQWFGNVTFWLFWENGYQALASLDDDSNGELAGEELRDLAIWHDRNSNGMADPGEVRALSAHGIVALSCRHVRGDRLAFAAVSPQGVRLVNGRTRPTYDVMLRAVDVRTLTQR